MSPLRLEPGLALERPQDLRACGSRVTIKPDDAAAAIAARPRPVCYVLERESQADLAVSATLRASLRLCRARTALADRRARRSGAISN
jgi:hypothetical protein